MDIISKMLKSVVMSSTKSLLSSGLKQSVKGIIKKQMQKSQQDIEKEMTETIGYATSHFKLDKQQNIVYRPSSVFFHEWLTNSPLMKDKLIKDEENGQVYYQGRAITNQDKVAIIHSFIKTTNAQSTALSYHFDNALKLLEASDFNAEQFKQAFAGWDPSKPSVIDSFIEKCFGTALVSSPEYSRLLFRKWIVGTAARIIQPGKLLDGCLVLQGKTDIGKTSFFRNLMPSPFNNRTGEVFCDVKSPNKIVEALLGKSVASFDELSVLEQPNTLEIFKQLLTSQWVDVRLAWAKQVRRFNMRAGLSATTNKEQFITDPSLSRRLWVIELNNSQRLDFKYLDDHKTALWQEAVYLAQKGETSILTPDERSQVESYNNRFMIGSSS